MAADLANNINREREREKLTNELLQEVRDITDDTSNRFAWSPAMSNGEIEYIVSMFRSGSQISVFSPEGDENSSRATIEKDPNNTPVSSNEASLIEQARPVKPTVIVVTNRVNEGDPIPALPSWIDINFSHEDYHIKKSRLNTMCNNEYVDTHRDNTKPSDRNQGWLNNNEESSFYLDKGLGVNSEENEDSSETK